MGEEANESFEIKLKTSNQITEAQNLLDIHNKLGLVSEKCRFHNEDIILLCLKDQERVCSQCLHSTHLLHPVVPFKQFETLDFQHSLDKEVASLIEEVRDRKRLVQKSISENLKKYKV